MCYKNEKSYRLVYAFSIFRKIIADKTDYGNKIVKRQYIIKSDFESCYKQRSDYFDNSWKQKKIRKQYMKNIR